MKHKHAASSVWHAQGNEHFFRYSQAGMRQRLKHAMLRLLGRLTISAWVIYLPFVALFLYLSDAESALRLNIVVPWMLLCFFLAVLRSVFSYYLSRLDVDGPVDRCEFVYALICALLALSMSSGIVYFFGVIDPSWRLIIMMMASLFSAGSAITLSASPLSFGAFTILLVFPIAYIGVRSDIHYIEMTAAAMFFLIPLLFYFSIVLYKLLYRYVQRELHLITDLALERKLVSLLQPLIFISNDDNIIAANNEFLEVMNFSPDEVVNRPIKDVFAGQPQMMRQVKKLYFDLEKTVSETDDVSSHEFDIVVPHCGSADGPAYFSVSCHLLLSPANTRVFVWILQNISVQHRETASLRKKEQLYRGLVEISGEMLLCLDASLKVVFCNEKGGRELFGFSVMNLGSQNFLELFYEPELFTEEDLRTVSDLKTTLHKEACVRSINVGNRKRVRVTLAPFHQTDSGVHFVAAVSEVFSSVQAEDHLSYLATHDELTGLPNRRYLMDKMALLLGSSARRHGEFVALFLIDLDKFKQVNDVFGHKAGDHVLEVSSLRLRSCARKSDIVARMGGDEFVMFLTGLSVADDVATIAQRVVDIVGQPIRFGKEVLQVYASVGIALYPIDGASVEIVLNMADRAMYSAKKAGANRYCFNESRSVREVQAILDNYF